MPEGPQKTLLRTYTDLIEGVQEKIFCVKCYVRGMHRHRPQGYIIFGLFTAPCTWAFPITPK